MGPRDEKRWLREKMKEDGRPNEALVRFFAIMASFLVIQACGGNPAATSPQPGPGDGAGANHMDADSGRVSDATLSDRVDDAVLPDGVGPDAFIPSTAVTAIFDPPAG